MNNYKGFYEELIKGLNEMVGDGKKYRYATDMARESDTSPMYINRMLKEQKTSSLKNIGKLLDAVGGKLFFPENQAVMVCNLASHLSEAADNKFETTKKLNSQNCFAVPLISLKDASLLSDPDSAPKMSQIKSWVVISEGMESMRMKSSAKRPDSLFAIELDRHFDHMEPTLQPGDVVVVDRDDKYERFSPPGNIFVAKNPDHEESYEPVKISRVMTEPHGRDLRVIYYYDNMQKHVPRTWSLKEDFNDNIENSIIGRIIWSWSNMFKR